MSNVNTASQIDEGKLNGFIGQMLGDLGGASSIAMVRMGDALGLYKQLHAKGPMTSVELANSAKVDPRYLREWLSNQASSNYLSYDPASAKFALPPEQAMVFAIEESPVYLMGAFDLMAALLDNQSKVQTAFKSGGGVAWGDQAGCMARLSQPPGIDVASCPRRRRHEEARDGGKGRRHRLWTRLVDRHDGQGFSEIPVHRL